MIQRLCRIFFCMLVCSLPVWAQSLSEKAYAAYQRKDFPASAQLYLDALKAGDRDSNTYYNGACALALAGKPNEAFELLGQLLKQGWADVGQLKQDEDFSSLRADARWQTLVAQTEAAQKRQNDFWNSPAFKTPFSVTLSEDEKVAGLSKFWSEVRFNFANFDLVPTLDWDKLYLEYLPKVRQAKTTLEYYRALTELCAQLKDAHTNVNYPNELRDEVFARPLIATRLLEGRTFIRLVMDEKLKQDGMVPGLEIVEVNGVPVRQYAEINIKPYQSASTSQDMETRMFEYSLLNGSVKDRVEITLRDAEGKQFKKTLPRVGNGLRSQLAPKRVSFEFKVLPGNIGYIALNEFESNEASKQFIARFDEIAKTDALIFDIRENGGGNSGVGWDILTYLTDKPFKTSRWRTRNYRPSFRAWGTPEGWFDGGTGERKPNGSKLYSKPVVVLTSPRTFSAAEDFAVAFDAMQRGKLVGQPTGGSTGQPLFFQLPGGGSARVCTKRDTYPDGREFVGVGVQPQLAVAPTIMDLHLQRDTVLEAALAELKKRN